MMTKLKNWITRHQVAPFYNNFTFAISLGLGLLYDAFVYKALKSFHLEKANKKEILEGSHV